MASGEEGRGPREIVRNPSERTILTKHGEESLIVRAVTLKLRNKNAIGRERATDTVLSFSRKKWCAEC